MVVFAFDEDHDITARDDSRIIAASENVKMRCTEYVRLGDPAAEITGSGVPSRILLFDCRANVVLTSIFSGTYTIY